jgi:ABC-type Zn uptake system ZnuABC Zn-binding protein ZnuA
VLKIRTLLLLFFLLCITSSVIQAQERLQIVASFTILADVAQQVAGDAADVSSLIPTGADPHSFSPTPQDLIAVVNADVVLTNGINFEEGLIEAITNAGETVNISIVSDCVNILSIGASVHDEEETEAHSDEVALGESDMSAIAARCAAHYIELGIEFPEDHEEHEESEEPHVEALGLLYAINCGEVQHEEGDEEQEHVEGICDPHVWTNPENVMLWTLQIRDILSEIDPANAVSYVTNASIYIETLRALENDELLPLIETLPTEHRILVTNHETLGYFAVHYDFELIGVVFEGGTAVAEPSAAEIAGLVDIIRTTGVPAIFAENTAGDVLIQRVSEETTVTVAHLYSDSLGDAESPASSYIDYLRYNVQTIVTALTLTD